MKKLRINSDLASEFVGIRIPPSVVEFIEKASERSMSTKSQWIRDAIVARLRAEGVVEEQDIDNDLVSA